MSLDWGDWDRQRAQYDGIGTEYLPAVLYK